MAEACISRKSAGMACHIRHAVGVCKPPKGAVFKRHGAERLKKKWRIRCYQVSIKKLNESEPLMLCRKGLFVGKTTGSLHR